VKKFMEKINLSENQMNRKLLWFTLVMGFFLIGQVSSLGVTPARTSVDFESGLKKSINFNVLNSGGEEMDLVVYVQGELNSSLGLNENSFSMSGSEESRQLTYELSLPQTLSPGLHTGEVVVMQLPKKSETSGAFIGASVAVVSQIYVYVPYPGKYAEAKMNIINDDKTGEVVFIFPVLNRGEFDLASARANVDIYNKMGEKIDSFNTDSISVMAGEKGEIVHRWAANVSFGEYRATGSLIYDEGIVNLEKIFSVGSRDLELQEVSVREFNLGEIAKIEMLVENKWNEKVSDAFVETRIYNDKGGTVSEFKSATYDIDPLTKQVFVSYWDTSGVREGTYETEVSINYGDRSSEKSLEFMVESNKLTVMGLGYVISEEGNDGKGSLTIILVVIIVVLILINLLWFLLLRKRLKK
jgi:hypothetical protein